MNAEITEMQIFTVGIPLVDMGGISMVQEEKRHEHDYVGNWLWDDDTCILWDDGLVIAL